MDGVGLGRMIFDTSISPRGVILASLPIAIGTLHLNP